MFIAPWRPDNRFYSPPRFLHFRILKKWSVSHLSLVKRGACSRVVYQHAQLHGQHGHPGLLLGLLLSLPQGLGSSCVTHVSKANFGNIEPLSLDAHASHVLPDSLTVRNRKEKQRCYSVTFKAWGLEQVKCKERKECERENHWTFAGCNKETPVTLWRLKTNRNRPQT